MGWSGIDIAIIAVIAISIITGVMRGFLRELIALFAWILAIWLSFKYCHLVAAWLSPYVPDRNIQLGAGFLVMLVFILLMGAVVNAILGFLLRHSGLSSADRLLGMGFGFTRGVLIVSLAMAIIGLTGFNIKSYQASSRLYAYFEPLSNWVAASVQPLLDDAIKKSKALGKKPAK
jgi:membrane protein required for colicin V production